MMKKYKYIYYLILIIILVSIWSSGILAYREWLEGDVCLKILGMPSCYIVLICFILSLGAHKAQEENGVHSFLFFIGLVWSITSYGSLGEILGYAECPETDNGIPMCYISWSICSSLFILKFIEQNLKTKNK